ncbi:MAG: ligase-associated DNA damage response endonuclease PdeM [Ferruginibacter sp.]
MTTFAVHEIFGHHFILSHDRTVFWEEERALIISDLHLGKSGHFRKHGIGIPQNIFKEDMQRLIAAIQLYKPLQVIIVGDMFHSHDNSEHALFLKWRNDFPQLPIHLVMGNHDILDSRWYEEASLTCHEEQLAVGKFIFTHDINDIELAEDLFYFSGHIHPGVRMEGIGKQALQLPCFYFGEQYAVLPAFGRFTGTIALKINKTDNVYALTGNRVMQVQ